MPVTRFAAVTISFMASPAFLTSFVPSLTVSVEFSIIPLIFFAAAAERCARLRTSVATTANSRPCSRRRARTGIRCCGHRSAQPGTTLGGCRKKDQRDDRKFDRYGEGWHKACQKCRRRHEGYRHGGKPSHRHDG